MIPGDGPGVALVLKRSSCWRVFPTISTGLKPQKILNNFLEFGPIEMWKTRVGLSPLDSRPPERVEKIDTVK